MKVLRLMPALALLLSSLNARAETPPGPLQLFPANSACQAMADRAAVPIAIGLANLATAESLGIYTSQRAQRAENFRLVLAQCQRAEVELEMAQVNPAGAASAARASLDAKLLELQQLARKLIEDPEGGLSPGDAVDQRWNAEISDRLQRLQGRIRQAQPYLPNSELTRKAFQKLLEESLQTSVDCRVLEKRGQDALPCLARLRSQLDQGEARIELALQELAPAYAMLGQELAAADKALENARASADGLRAYTQNLAAAASSTRGNLQKLRGDLQGLHGQAATMDYYRLYYWWTGYYYYNVAVYYGWLAYWWPAYAPYYQYYLGVAYGYWAWYGYFDHAFQTITQQLLPGLMAEIHRQEGYLAWLEQSLAAMPAAQSAADASVLNAIRALHSKRQQLVSTCLPAPPASNGMRPACINYTGKGIL